MLKFVAGVSFLTKFPFLTSVQPARITKLSTCSMKSCSSAPVSYINASVAKGIDDSLMRTPGFTLDTLMELAGYSVACAIHDFTRQLAEGI